VGVAVGDAVVSTVGTTVSTTVGEGTTVGVEISLRDGVGATIGITSEIWVEFPTSSFDDRQPVTETMMSSARTRSAGIARIERCKEPIFDLL
jgi:hypothetical protein